MHVGVSIGIATFPGGGHQFEGLLKAADLAMYQAKALGRNNCQFFVQSMQNRADVRVQLERELLSAMEQRQCLCHFQPQVAAAGSEFTGVETSIRWEKPGGGLVPPGDFIPIAEDTGLIIPLGEWVLEATCKQAQTLLQARLLITDVVFAVNVSVGKLVNGDLVPIVGRVLETTGVPAACLELEVTE